MTIAALALAACAAGPKADVSSAQMVVELTDYKVASNVATLKSGKAKIGVRNISGQLHEVILIKTDTAADKLPVDGGTSKAKEDVKVASAMNIGAGGVVAMDVDLAPGNYLLICNVAGHYQLGMRSAFKVE